MAQSYEDLAAEFSLSPYCASGVGPGWVPLLRELFEGLRAEGHDLGSISQIKEKFGTLRVYLSGISDEADELIAKAEAKSAVTCEECGEPGTLRTKGWWRTRCDGCAK